MPIRKGEKTLAQRKKHDDEEKGQPLQVSSISRMETSMQTDGESGQTCETNLDVILKNYENSVSTPK